MVAQTKTGTEPRKKPIGLEMSFIESIRKRPAMYVGSTGIFGFINYLVCPIALLLANGAKRIDVTIDDGFEVSSDAQFTLDREDGRIVTFEEMLPTTGDGHNLEAPILTALSQELYVSVKTGTTNEELRYSQGALVSHKSSNVEDATSGTTLRFKPDNTIFEITEISLFAFESYFRRLSFLHCGVRFSIITPSERKEFFQKNGIVDLFVAISSPYQLMHEPIHVIGQEGRLTLELVMAHHSWSEDHLMCFINHGRAVEAGTHEQGLKQGLKRLKKKLGLREKSGNGVLALASLRYLDAVWEGCIKERVANLELRPMVSRLVVNEVTKWLAKHPDVAEQLKYMQRFQFPDVWYS